ncbi:MAG: aldehyde ferredoxin oxidoreductase family protein [Chloroflexi bacterium]|nr:aldehyde ferredoxin oxidoreductase family protein [Chloroflexota bacterium]
MVGGYMGKILYVDLASGKIEYESPDEKFYRDFIGGYGLGARVIFSRQKAGADPLGPDNMLGFITGPLTGTPVPFGSRYTVVGKSPLTQTWGDANSGGDFGPHLKFAGYDAVFFAGVSERPVYLFINEQKAELRDASHLWNKDSNETEHELLAELGRDTHIACIGPSGEKLSLISAIMNNEGRAAARSGLAAVMGSKRLKAVAVKGNLTVPLADREKTSELRRRLLQEIRGPAADHRRRYGTSSALVPLNMSGGTPVKNWGGTAAIDFPNAEAIGGDMVITYEVKKFACWRCPTPCGAILEIKEGPYAVLGHKPEYETLAAFGTMCLNDNVESIIKANDICNRYGLDTISTGATIAFAIECYENGLITKGDTEGIELKWGNHAAIVAMTEKLAKREGFGDLLADGVKRAAERIGKGADKYAVHVHGQEPPMHDPKLRPGIATTYSMDATPARHMQGGAHIVEMRPESQKGIEFAPLQRYIYSGKGDAHKKMSAFKHIVNCSGLCIFGDIASNANAMVESISTITGWNYSVDELLETGDRIANLRVAFNYREGLNPLEFDMPTRMLGQPPLEVGPTAGVTVDLKTQARDYVEAMGWDPITGKPTVKTLRQLGLDDMAEALWP